MTLRPKVNSYCNKTFDTVYMQSIFLMGALAQNGYLVLAPNLNDATCAGDSEWFPGRPEQPFRDAALWNDATYKDRAADMQTLLDAVLKEKTFAGVPVDGTRIGIAGHSLGGYTALGLAGGWKSWKDSRIKSGAGTLAVFEPFPCQGRPGPDHHACDVPATLPGPTSTSFTRR